VVERNDWSAYQRRANCGTLPTASASWPTSRSTTSKLAAAEQIIEDWLKQAVLPRRLLPLHRHGQVRGEHLEPLLKKKFPKLDLQVITSELPDELRKQRIEVMGHRPSRAC
jgi:hypothetical protein